MLCLDDEHKKSKQLRLRLLLLLPLLRLLLPLQIPLKKSPLGINEQKKQFGAYIFVCLQAVVFIFLSWRLNLTWYELVFFAPTSELLSTRENCLTVLRRKYQSMCQTDYYQGQWLGRRRTLDEWFAVCGFFVVVVPKGWRVGLLKRRVWRHLTRRPDER